MGSILVIEPSKILQQATVIALFPEYQAQMMETIPEGGELLNFDAVIVDAVELREARALSAEKLSVMETWAAPMVWIDGDPPQPPKRDKLVIVKRPISRAAMRAALAECLGRASMPGGRALNTAGEQASVATPTERRVIELVDIVDDGPASVQSKGEKKKKK